MLCKTLTDKMGFVSITIPVFKGFPQCVNDFPLTLKFFRFIKVSL